MLRYIIYDRQYTCNAYDNVSALNYRKDEEERAAEFASLHWFFQNAGVILIVPKEQKNISKQHHKSHHRRSFHMKSHRDQHDVDRYWQNHQ